MQTNKNAPASGQLAEGTFESRPLQYNIIDGFSYYNSHQHTAPAKFISLDDLANEVTFKGPRIGPKSSAPLIAPFRANGKEKADAQGAKFCALVIDHDDDDKSRDQINAVYDPYGMAYFAFTSANHEQDKKGVIAKRWKVVIPLAEAVAFDDYAELAQGAALHLQSDKAQSRITQGFYAPNILTKDAPFDCIDATDRPPLHKASPLVTACLTAYKLDQEAKQAKANKATPKPRPTLTGNQAGIIDKVNAQHVLEDELRARHYTRQGKNYLSPQSSTGNAGVIILTGDDGKERCYSHHGETDPLSNLNHDGHALDVFDVLCVLDHGGDVSQAVAHYAPRVDADGQKRRQRAHMAAQDDPIADIRALFEKPAEDPEPEEETPERPNANGVDLLKPPGLAGEICRYMALNARRSSPELYPLAALHLMALVGRKRRSLYTDKLNLITLSIAPTAAGKENTQDAVKRLARDHYCSNLIHGNAGSFKELVLNLLEGHGASLYVVDEIHSLLGSMKDKNAATYETKMEAEILTMSSTKLYTFRGMEKRSLLEVYGKQASQIEGKLEKAEGEEADKLIRALEKAKTRLDWLENGLPDPFFSLMGHSVPSRLDSFIRTDNIDSGFLGRTLVARGTDTRSKLRRTPVDEHALALCGLNITNGLTDVRRSASTVGVDDDAADYLDKCIDWYDQDEQLNHHVAGGIYARAPEHLYRVATILALETGTITLEHARYADALVKHSIDNISYILLKAYAESDGAQEKQVIEHARQTIHRNCKGLGQPPSRVKNLVTRPTGWQEMQAKDVKRDRFAELIDTMLASGELELQEDGKRKRYLSRSCV